jgi:glutathione S-transferase
MALTLHYHPLASFPWKVLTALYENGTPFEGVVVNLGDPESAAAFKAIWPIGKMPVLVDDARGETVPETSIIIEYLALHYPGPVELLPRDPEAALEVRLQDRFFDAYIQTPMQKIVTDRLRAEGTKDPFGVDHARDALRTACGVAEARIKQRTWAVGDAFTMADCSAGPALFYANKVQPLGSEFPALSAYLERLKARPAFARVLAEAEPFFQFFPE